jgi:hypothetical protein
LAALSVVRDIQVPILSVLLLGGCAAKARKALRAHSVSEALGPTAMFPLRLRRPVAVVMCASEFGLGGALILTAGRSGSGMPATTVRLATALLFLTAVGALHELRTRRPEAGCGCFGDLSETPVGLRAIIRSAVLSAMAVASVGAPPLRVPSTPRAAAILIGCAILEIVVIAAVSPELGEILVRLGYSEPCEIRRVPATRTLAALRSSSAWRRYRRQLTAHEPADMWREGCWRMVAYTAVVQGRAADIVFAVYLQDRRPPVRAAVLDAATGEPLTAPRAATRPVTGTHPLPILAAPIPEQSEAATPPHGFRATAPATGTATPPHGFRPAHQRRHSGVI